MKEMGGEGVECCGGEVGVEKKVVVVVNLKKKKKKKKVEIVVVLLVLEMKERKGVRGVGHQSWGPPPVRSPAKIARVGAGLEVGGVVHMEKKKKTRREKERKEKEKERKKERKRERLKGSDERGC